MGYRIERRIERRIDIDWLRITVFGILILYHIGMVYVANWGYHVKSEYQSGFLENIMLLVNRWRLPLLFVISGFATSQMMKKYSIEAFIRVRTFYLLLPLLFGILVIVPPQLFIEMIQKGDFKGGFWQFMVEFYRSDSDVFEDYQAGVFPHIDVNHLWYLRELWVYSMVLILLAPALNHSRLKQTIQRSCYWAKGWGILLIPLLPLCVSNALLFEQDPELAKDMMYFIFFVYGYWLSQRAGAWRLIVKMRWAFLSVALVSYVIVLWFYNHPQLLEPETVLGQICLTLVGALSRWSWILAILGVVKHAYDIYKSGSECAGRNLKYLNEAVYPFYILHQTIIVVTAYYLSGLHLGPFLEPIVLILITVVACWLGFEIIRRISVLRPLFGVKLKSRDDHSYFGEPTLFTKCLTLLCYGLLIPFAAIILF